MIHWLKGDAREELLIDDDKSAEYLKDNTSNFACFTTNHKYFTVLLTVTQSMLSCFRFLAMLAVWLWRWQ